jgi:3-methyladenine DNA glycosylase Tag
VKLRDFDKIFALAAARKGGRAALLKLLADTKPRTPRTVAKLGDDRVLAAMTRTVFAGGFGWHIIEGKWPGFEAAFGGFDPHACAFLNDERLDTLMRDRRIIRSPQKIMGVPKNARFVLDLAAEHGSAARFFAPWPDETVIDLIAIIRKRGTGFGFENAARFLRAIGKPAFIASPDVVAALVREGVLDRPSSGKKALAQMQAALNHWSAESGHDLTTLSRVLAMSGGRMPTPQRGYLSRM